MTVTLTPQQEEFVAEQLQSGHYHSATDVVAQSLELLQAQEKFIYSNVAELRDKVAVDLEQIRRGDVVDGKTPSEPCGRNSTARPQQVSETRLERLAARD